MTAPQLEGATPRPWRVGRFYHSEHDEEPAWYEIWGAESGKQLPANEVDAALIVAAVNDYDRLRRIEEAARAWAALHTGVVPCDGQCDLTVALRSALAAAPSRPVERED